MDHIFDVPQIEYRQVIPGRFVTDRTSSSHLERDLFEEEERRLMSGEMRSQGVRDPWATLESTHLGLVATDLPFDAYLEERIRSHQDLMNLYTAIDFLRYMEGEKHLLYFTPHGVVVPKAGYENILGSLASDARVRIHAFQTGSVPSGEFGGVNVSQRERERLSEQVRASLTNPDTAQVGRSGEGPTVHTLRSSPSEDEDKIFQFSDLFSLSVVSLLSSFTGGQAFIGKEIGNALTSLQASTKATYHLGYIPENKDFDERFRRIEVKVLREGVKAYTRSGYYAKPRFEPYDREQFMSYARTQSAARYDKNVSDISISFAAIWRELEEKQGFDIAVVVQPYESLFRLEGNRFCGELQVSYFLFSKKGQALKAHSERVEMRLSEEKRKLYFEKGIPIRSFFPVPDPPKEGSLKVVVYDARNDLIASQIQKIVVLRPSQ